MSPLAHRRFVASVSHIADVWFASPVFTGEIKVEGEYTASADGACPVSLPDGSRAYVKPRPNAELKRVVAREKIAFDLAHLLRLPVAPVAIREPDSERGWPNYTAMSLVALQQGRLWVDGGTTHLQIAAHQLEALRVYWTWIGDSDHNQHGGNLLYEIKDGQCAIAAIDHSYSLCHNNAVNSLTVGASAGYGAHALEGMTEIRSDVTAAICALEMQQIENIVRRLDKLLTLPEQNCVLDVLQSRRVALAGMLGL